MDGTCKNDRHELIRLKSNACPNAICGLVKSAMRDLDSSESELRFNLATRGREEGGKRSSARAMSCRDPWRRSVSCIPEADVAISSWASGVQDPCDDVIAEPCKISR